ncbi:cytochrome P450 [Nocardioides sp. TF02-7]|uniref:cytochrome P450 n=1 Tax=Nocardioides sp. TF02-7 TaxID=2917724 RepID=UPI001F06D0E2|nr:cytochrome P450 [Nocardioides sp. TF02-7]UMG91182.1 cytochrome P450 [Nocardioides sp. TF02-7]
MVAQCDSDKLVDLPHDLITVLLKTYGDDWDDDLRLRETLFYLAAATSTTTHASPHIFAEIVEWLRGHPEQAERARDRSFLQRAVAEGLRLHPPVPGLLRGALTTVTLSSGRVIAEGEQLLLDLNAANRDPAVYGDDADAFDPDRVPLTRAHLYALSFAAGPPHLSGASDRRRCGQRPGRRRGGTGRGAGASDGTAPGPRGGTGPRPACGRPDGHRRAPVRRVPRGGGARRGGRMRQANEAPSFRAVVDRDRCLGTGSCEHIDPARFEVDDLGLARWRDDAPRGEPRGADDPCGTVPAGSDIRR